ncbi:hypothetical protein [Pseudogracilibacillus sp. ICA-222130]|uniref:hypothetical protein n=1 Tax=Pseudogracilibacillus sp. ICA-222130 TaxID=3134655 RepID=UPI0030C23609
MEWFQMYQWEVFIFLEIASWIFLFLFLLLRYAFDRVKIGQIFLLLFLLFILLEGILAFINYQQTGEIETFQIVVCIFIIYACTFGISDFKKLDRYIKQKVGKWRKVDLLTEKDRAIMEKQQNPTYIARRYRLWWYMHTIVLIIANIIFWQLYGDKATHFLSYIQDWSWFEQETIHHAPYKHEMVMNIVRLWLVIYVVDTIIAWSYTFFPNKEKGE